MSEPVNPQEQPTIKEQPVVQAPPQNYQQPTPAQQQAPYEQQPVQQQYFAQPNAAQVHYVIQAQSLKGLQGWLGFFMVAAGIFALSYATALVATVSSLENAGPTEIVNVIFLPLLLAASITAVVLLALEKRIARYAYIGFGSLVLLHSIVSTATTGDAALVMTGFLSGAIWLTFVILYFVTSKRVKETLVK